MTGVSAMKNENVYSRLMDAIEILHAENLILMQTVLNLHLPKEQADTLYKDMENLWNKKMDDVRKSWW